MNKKLSDELYKLAVSLIYESFVNVVKDDEIVSVVDKLNYPVLKSFDENLSVLYLIFAKNDIKIDPNAKDFDIVIDISSTDVYIKGISPDPSKFKDKWDYALALSKELRFAIEMYLFDSINRIPNEVLQNVASMMLYEFSRYLQNKSVYVAKEDEEFRKLYRPDRIDRIKDMVARIIGVSLKIPNFNASDLDKIIEYIEAGNLQKLKQVFPKDIIQKIAPYVYPGRKLDIEYYNIFKNLGRNFINNMSNQLNTQQQQNQSPSTNSSSSNNRNQSQKTNNKTNTNIQQNSNNDPLQQLQQSMYNQQIKNQLMQQYGLSKYDQLMQDKMKNQFTKHKNLAQMLTNKLRDEIEKIKGDLPGGVYQLLNRIIKVSIPWDRIFEQVIGSKMDISLERTWTFPKLHLLPITYLPGHKTEPVINTIAIMIDTSGSMSDEELSKALYIIYDLAVANNVSKIQVIQHDYELQDIKEFNIDEISDPKIILKEITIKGRGGTSHEIPFRKLFNEIYESGEFEIPDLFIIFSDFVSDFEKAHKILDIHNIPYVCISTEDTSFVKSLPKDITVIYIDRDNSGQIITH